jgi:hypothetical protein
MKITEYIINRSVMTLNKCTPYNYDKNTIFQNILLPWLCQQPLRINENGSSNNVIQICACVTVNIKNAYENGISLRKWQKHSGQIYFNLFFEMKELWTVMNNSKWKFNPMEYTVVKKKSRKYKNNHNMYHSYLFRSKKGHGYDERGLILMSLNVNELYLK